jgi:predicted RNA-binding Zn ribbon-like protein
MRMLLAAKTRGAFDAEAAARLERAAGDARSRPTYDDGGPVALVPGDPTVDGAVGALLAAFAVARATAEWPHFRLCARKGCRRAFYDGSRSRTGRWCTSRCGNRVRMATYRRSKKRR